MQHKTTDVLPNPVIVQSELDEPVATEIIAQSIVKIDAAMKALLSAGLRKHTIVVLIADRTKLSRTNIEKVLDAINDLKRCYTTK